MNKDVTNGGNDIYTVYKSFYSVFDEYLLIPLTNINKVINDINKCSGIIMQGGDDFLDIHIDIIKYLYERDIPLLAICMSMQAMGVLFNGKLGFIEKHNINKKYVHYVNIKNNTLLYDIIKQDKILVNSYHKQYLTKTDLYISGYSNCIEAIEDKNKRFFLGLQWHPEKMVEYDNIERKIFDYFKEVCDGIKRVN